jgi:peptide deformylase
MILPIVAYGTPVLKQKATEISADYPALNELIGNMFETMYKANGVGLAAPQIGLPIRVFIIDASPFSDEEPELKGMKKVFINAQIIEENGDNWSVNEGCLSIPGIREDISRKREIKMRYVDENFVEQELECKGYLARIILHEYDHIEGKLFTDRISPLRKTLLSSKLNNISKGSVKVDYRMKFPQFKR